MPAEETKSRRRIRLPQYPDLTYEQELWDSGVSLVAGIDEAGRGALAGPVVAAVVLLPVDINLCVVWHGVRDSKMMTSQARYKWSKLIRETCADYGIGSASNQEIDSLGIVPATHLAIERALSQLKTIPEHLLTDYLHLDMIAIPQTPLIKGDARCLSIASASILAKTYRDELMICIDDDYPEYGFKQHKGYGTQAHRRTMQIFGPSPLHRLSFNYKAVTIE